MELKTIQLQKEKEMEYILYTLLQNRINELSKEYIPVEVSTNSEDIWRYYQNKLEILGYNPIFRKRRVYECNICKEVFKIMFKTVWVNSDGTITTPFDIFRKIDNEGLKKLFENIHNKIINSERLGIFVPGKRKYGSLKTKTLIEINGNLIPIEFPHVYLEMPNHDYIKMNEIFGILKNTFEFYINNSENIDNVLQLIEDGLYKGEQYYTLIKELKKIVDDYSKSSCDLDIFIISLIAKYRENLRKLELVTHLKNTAIGILIENPNNIDEYLKAVDPTNYKQVKNKIVNELEIKNFIKEFPEYKELQKLEHLNVDEVIDISNIIYSTCDDNEDLISLLGNNIKQCIPKNTLGKIDLNKLIDLLHKKRPNSIKIEYKNNLEAYLIGNKDIKLFKNSNTIIMYSGGTADYDLIDKKVKEKGGVIEAPLRMSLYWESLCDFDLHLKIYDTYHVYFNNKRVITSDGTTYELDVDMNVNNPIRGAVENIYSDKFPTKAVLLFYVHNYCKREKNNGFICKLKIKDEIYKFKYDKELDEDETVNVCKITIKNGNYSIENYIPMEKITKSEEKYYNVKRIFLFPEKNPEYLCFELIKEPRSNEIKGFLPEHLPDNIFRKYRRILQNLSDKTVVKLKNNKSVLLALKLNRKHNDTIKIILDNKKYELEI